MSIYAIGDVQGCFSALQHLLEKIHFDPKKDILWFTGDLVNRGPESLATLRFVKSLGNQQRTVLGNHDLHLLAVAYGARNFSPNDTLQEILSAPDREELCEWLCHLPLVHYDKEINYMMVHAGLAPEWNLETVLSLSKEVEALLQSEKRLEFFLNIFGNSPDHWSKDLKEWERIRCIINYFTRIRFCYSDGRMELNYKGKIGDQPPHLLPWFQLTSRNTAIHKIIFGHWAALNGETATPNTYALDTGCVWGNCLTAMRLEDDTRFSVKCQRLSNNTKL